MNPRSHETRRHAAIVSDMSLTTGDGRMRRSARLYAEIARTFDVIAVTRVAANEDATTLELAPGLIEHRVPRTGAEADWQSIATNRWGMQGGDDAVWFERVSALNPLFMNTLRAAVADAVFSVCLRPYAYAALRSLPGPAIVYDALELEYPRRTRTSRTAPNAVELLETVARIEQDCVLGAAALIVGSSREAKLAALLYDVDPLKMLVLKPTFDSHVVAPISHDEREARKTSTSLNGRKFALFVGSHTPENVQSTIALISVAAQLPEIVFVIAGSVSDVFPPIARPRNLQFTGRVDDATLRLLLDAADLFIDAGPSNRTDVSRKTLDAVAHGAPLVLSPQAAAGVFRDGIDADVAPVEALPQRIEGILRDPVRRELQTSRARKTAEERYPLSAAAAPVLELFDSVASATVSQ